MKILIVLFFIFGVFTCFVLPKKGSSYHRAQESGGLFILFLPIFALFVYIVRSIFK